MFKLIIYFRTVTIRISMLWLWEKGYPRSFSNGFSKLHPNHIIPYCRDLNILNSFSAIHHKTSKLSCYFYGENKNYLNVYKTVRKNCYRTSLNGTTAFFAFSYSLQYPTPLKIFINSLQISWRTVVCWVIFKKPDVLKYAPNLDTFPILSNKGLRPSGF